MNQSSTDSSTSTGPEVSADVVSRRAYEIWESEGRPEGCDFRHWLQAEHELKVGDGAEDTKRTETPAAPRGTVAEARPPSSARAGNNLNRDPKRNTSVPFGGEKNGGSAAQNQNAARRKPTNAPVL